MPTQSHADLHIDRAKPQLLEQKPDAESIITTTLGGDEQGTETDERREIASPQTTKPDGLYPSCVVVRLHG